MKPIEFKTKEAKIKYMLAALFDEPLDEPVSVQRVHARVHDLRTATGGSLSQTQGNHLEEGHGRVGMNLVLTTRSAPLRDNQGAVCFNANGHEVIEELPTLTQGDTTEMSGFFKVSRGLDQPIFVN
jgi:hypothetical protein